MSKLPRTAVIGGLVVGVVTSGAVSCATPDGNLVVTLVPGLVVGAATFRLLRWLSKRSNSR